MTATGARMLAWVRRNVIPLVAMVLATAFVAFMVVSTLRLAEEREARLEAIEDLTVRTAANAAENRQRAIDQCEATNDSNQTLRELLDATIRRRPAESFTAEDRQIAIDTYRRLPHTDCATQARTYFDPPFADGS